MSRWLISRKISALEDVREDIFELRIKLAEAVDERIHAILLLENQEYGNLQAELARHSSGLKKTAKKLLGDLERLDELEVEIAGGVDMSNWKEEIAEKVQLENKLGAMYVFIAKNTGEVANTRGAAEVCLQQLVNDIDVQASPIESKMAAMRDQYKQGIYGQVADTVEE